VKIGKALPITPKSPKGAMIYKVIPTNITTIFAETKKAAL